MRGECTHQSTGTGRLGLPCWQSCAGRGGPEKGHRAVQARALPATARSCSDARPGAHFQAKTQPFLKVHCLGNTLNIRRFHSFLCLDFHMPPDMESHADAAISKPCSQKPQHVWHLLTCKSIEKAEMCRLQSQVVCLSQNAPFIYKVKAA